MTENVYQEVEGYSDTLADLLTSPAIARADLAELALRFAARAEAMSASPVPAERAWSAIYAFLAASAEVALVRRRTGVLV